MIDLKALTGYDDSKCAIKMTPVDYIVENHWDEGGYISAVRLSKNPLTDEQLCKAIGDVLGCKVTMKHKKKEIDNIS